MTQPIGESASATASGPVEAGHAGPELASEVAFVLGHPRFFSSRQNRELLTFLADSHATEGASQPEIAQKVLGLGEEFNPAVDAHVRIVVGRLRQALATFYATHGAFRPFRINIPIGDYRVALVRNSSGRHGSHARQRGGPAFGWIVSSGAGFADQSLEHDLTRRLAQYLSRTPLVHDSAIRAVQLKTISIDAALREVSDAGIAFLAELSTRAGATHADIRLWHASDRKVIWLERVGMERVNDPVAALARRVSTCLTDPMTGILPDRLAATAPQSRLAVVMRFFRFMATQDRALLLGALRALDDIDGTEFASPLTRALRLDAIRANYCFATGHHHDLAKSHADDAARNLETDPRQPFAHLAYGYMKLAADRVQASGPDWTGTDAAQWFGSPSADLELFRTLNSGSGAAPDMNGMGSHAPKNTFLFLASRIIAAMREGDFAAAEAYAFRPDMPANFWARAFQCSSALELGKETKARHAYARLLKEVPGAEDFAGRAITRMIPDRIVHDRMLFHLAMLG